MELPNNKNKMLSTLRITVTSPTKAFTHTALGESAVKIGRSLRCDFSIPLEDLSREHCLFEIDDQHFYITDLGSANGVWVDRERIPAHERIQFTPESHVVLSNLYQLNIAPMEIKTKSDINVSMSSAPKDVPRDVKTLTFQLDFPEEREQPLPQTVFRKKPPKHVSEKADGETYEIAKMVLGFIVVAGIVIYSFVFK